MFTNDDNTFKSKRHKVEDREWLDEDFREYIASKSDHNCVCCGKKKYFSYGATIDHFIPLSKGGTNDEANLVMMCEDCNREKDNKIFSPLLGTKHLKEEYRRELLIYAREYFNKYRYIDRQNLLLCDVYPVFMNPEAAYNAAMKNSKKKNRILHSSASVSFLKKVREEDLPKIIEFFSKYAEKYDAYFDQKSTETMVNFWYTFGVIYYEEFQGEIKAMCPLTVDDYPSIRIKIFNYYSQPKDYIRCKSLIDSICMEIVRENDLPGLPFMLSMIKTDPLAAKVIGQHAEDAGSFLTSNFFFMADIHKPYTGFERFHEDEKLKEFFSQFKDVTKEATKFVEDSGFKNFLYWLTGEVGKEMVIKRADQLSDKSVEKLNEVLSAMKTCGLMPESLPLIEKE